MSSPVQSADLNPIEMVWDELDRKVRAKQTKSTTEKQDKTIFCLSVERMLRICEAILAAIGSLSNEWKV